MPRSLAEIAQQLVNHQEALQGGFIIPASAILPENFGFPRGLTEEEYVQLLKDKQI